MYLAFLAVVTISIAFLLCRICWTLLFTPTARVPGPKSFAWTKWRLAYEDCKGTRTRTIHRLHETYGPMVRVGPNEVSFNTLAALRQIYGAGSVFGRPESFY
ncbi:cytochrome P450 [Penicillium sp. IBT 16267x]|nr:cytochrome P450 [Penicillium sp. IBT 16267x]